MDFRGRIKQPRVQFTWKKLRRKLKNLERIFVITKKKVYSYTYITCVDVGSSLTRAWQLNFLTSLNSSFLLSEKLFCSYFYSYGGGGKIIFQKVCLLFFYYFFLYYFRVSLKRQNSNVIERCINVNTSGINLFLYLR